MLNKLIKSYSINSLANVYDLSFTHPVLKKNIELKDKYKNDRLFILGSGSSILLYDLTILKNEYVMTQNSFYMHKDISDIEPNFHCVVPYHQSDKEYSIWIDYVAEIKDRIPNSLFICSLFSISMHITSRPVSLYSMPTRCDKTSFTDHPGHSVFFDQSSSVNSLHKTNIVLQTVSSKPNRRVCSSKSPLSISKFGGIANTVILPCPYPCQ